MKAEYPLVRPSYVTFGKQLTQFGKHWNSKWLTLKLKHAYISVLCFAYTDYSSFFLIKRKETVIYRNHGQLQL